MLVLRFTTRDADLGQTSTEVQTPLKELVIGSDVEADVTLMNAGLAARALRLRLINERVCLEVLDAGGDGPSKARLKQAGATLNLGVGEEVTLGHLSIALLALPAKPSSPGFAFGGYDDDPALPTTRTFQLAEPGSTAQDPLPNASPPGPEAARSPPPDLRPVPRADEQRQPDHALNPGRQQDAAGQRAQKAQARAQPPAPSELSSRQRTSPPRTSGQGRNATAGADRKAGTTATSDAAASTAGSPNSGSPNSGSPNSGSPNTGSRPPRLTPAQKAALLNPVKFADPTFGEALVTQLKRAPFFALSVGFHTLLFLLLMLLDTTNDRAVLPEGPGAIMASMDAEDLELAAEVPEMEEDLGLPQAPSDEPDLLEDLELDDVPPPPEIEPPSPFREDMERLKQDELQPVDIGLMPGMRAASPTVVRRKPKMPRVHLKTEFKKGAAGSSNQQSAEFVRAELGSGRRGSGATLDDLKAEDILVVGGSFDHIERVLTMLRIKFVKKSPWSLFSPKLENFSSYKLVFWNCGESMGERRVKAIGKRLKKFVSNGGYLFTTDWGVANVLAFAFPGYLKTNGNRRHLPEMVLPIEPSRSAIDHPLLEGVFHSGVQGKWWLEQASFDISIGRKDAVTILIESPMLQSSFNRSPAVAATFNYRRGRVLHTMGHYYQEAGNMAGTLSAHRLALNFVLMRLDQDRGSARRKRPR